MIIKAFIIPSHTNVISVKTHFTGGKNNLPDLVTQLINEHVPKATYAEVHLSCDARFRMYIYEKERGVHLVEDGWSGTIFKPVNPNGSPIYAARGRVHWVNEEGLERGEECFTLCSQPNHFFPAERGTPITCPKCLAILLRKPLPETISFTTDPRLADALKLRANGMGITPGTYIENVLRDHLRA